MKNLVKQILTTATAIAVGLPRGACEGVPQVIVLAKEQTVKKKTTSELSFDLPEIKQGQQVRLSLLVRVNYPYWCANNPAMTMEVNGKPVVGRDLINKSLDYQCKNGREAFWTTPNGSSWLLFSWPDFDVAKVKAFDSPYALPDADPFHLVFDVTAYAKQGTNALKVYHDEILAEVDHYLVLRDVTVEAGDPVESRNLTTVVRPAPTGDLPSYLPRGKQRVPMSVQLSSSGAIRMKVGSRTLDITTRTSEPSGKWLETGPGKLSTLSQGKWSETKWNGTGYTVTRKMKVLEDHVTIADTFANPGKELVGVMLEHTVRSSNPPLDAKLGGRPPFARFQCESGGANPTAIARWADVAVGLVAEDDIFRSHINEFSHEGAFGLADHELGIEPGKSHTLEWSVYPVPKGDYWDVINAIRRNWGANITIPGPHVFV
ncbi:MAG: hypothetical protein HY318_01575, partial [Armatimonadetes bacterium]|nr:hypothetical protein [Armatimonadota bacterium]